MYIYMFVEVRFFKFKVVVPIGVQHSSWIEALFLQVLSCCASECKAPFFNWSTLPEVPGCCAIGVKYPSSIEALFLKF